MAKAPKSPSLYFPCGLLPEIESLKITQFISMHNLIICDLCNGKKVVIGLGMLQGKCTACNGIGYVERNEEKTISPKLEESQERKKNPAKPKKSKLHNN